MFSKPFLSFILPAFLPSACHISVPHLVHLIWPHSYYLATSTNYGAPCCTVSSHLMLLPPSEGQIFSSAPRSRAPLQNNNQNHNSVCLICTFFLIPTKGILNILNRMVARIPRIKSDFTLFVNAIFLCLFSSFVFQICHGFKGLSLLATSLMWFFLFSLLETSISPYFTSAVTSADCSSLNILIGVDESN
jgi:hypothetical protein